MTPSEINFAVSLLEVAAKLLPGAIEAGARLLNAITSSGELSDEQRAELVARVQSTRAAVAGYEPRPHPGSPSADVPEPKPTAPG
jgi:hypothetical protein